MNSRPFLKKLSYRALSVVLSSLLATLLPACAANTAKDNPQVTESTPALTLAQDGKTDYVIALAYDAIPSEQTAARELSEYLQKISGANFTVKPETQVGANEEQILVGAGARVKKLLPGQKWSELGEDGIVIKTAGNKLILAGGRPRGTLYAVYSFLEDTLGVRWWTPTESTVPSQNQVQIAPQNIVYVPQLRTREAYYTDAQKDPLFATRLKVNGHFQTQGAELGGHNSILGWCHTFSTLLPAEKYFKAHPEWYSDRTNGGKPSTAASPLPMAKFQSQLCLSNDAARRELTKNALEWIRKNPTAGTISISQDDNDHRCTCDADMALEKKEDSPAGPLLHFVNLVAADIEKEYPDFLVETLAYQYTLRPPLHERPRRNVVIRLCASDVDAARPFDSEANKRFREEVQDWKAIAPRLYIWNYVTNFSNVIFPHPNLQVLWPDIRYLVTNNAISLFEQGDAYSDGTGDFVQLRTWLVSHLMWNPQQDENKLIDEFMQGYYGAAAPPLQQYLELVRDSFLKTGIKLTPWPKDHYYLTLNVMNRASALFADAQHAVAPDKVLSMRVRRARLPLDHAWILRYEVLKRQAEAQQAEFNGPNELLPFIDDFRRTASEFGVRKVTEHELFDSYIARLRARYVPSAPLPEELQNTVPLGDGGRVMDVQQDQFKLYGTGDLVTLVDDPLASDGKAARLRGDIADWAIQYPFNDLETTPQELWHCYAMVRVETKPGGDTTYPAFVCGIYANKAGEPGKELIRVMKSAGEIDEGYNTIDLGTHALSPGAFAYIAPTKNPAVAAVYVDRIVLIKAGKAN